MKTNNVTLYQDTPINLAEKAASKLEALTEYFSHLFWPGWQPEPDCGCDACKLEGQISSILGILEREAVLAEPESQVA